MILISNIVVVKQQTTTTTDKMKNRLEQLDDFEEVRYSISGLVTIYRDIQRERGHFQTIPPTYNINLTFYIVPIPMHKNTLLVVNPIHPTKYTYLWMPLKLFYYSLFKFKLFVFFSVSERAKDASIFAEVC